MIEGSRGAGSQILRNSTVHATLRERSERGSNNAMNERESLRTYGKFVVAQPRLSAHEERVLFREFRAGNLRSQERIINSSLYLVVKEVWREIRAPLPVWDMIQAGTEGLIDATGAYDTESDAIFKAVAVFRIHAHLTNAIARDSNTIRIPVNLFAVFNFVNRRRPYNGDNYGLYVEEWRSAHGSEIDAVQVQESLDFPFLGHSMEQFDLELTNSVGLYDDLFLQASGQRDLNSQLATLEKREREFVDLYFGLTTGEPLTLEEIGAQYNLSRERIRQILRHSIRRLRHWSRSRKIRWMLEGDCNSTALTYGVPPPQFDDEYYAAQEQVLDRRQEMYGEFFWPIIGSMRKPGGFASKEFQARLGARAREFLAEGGIPRSFCDIVNDALSVFGDFPRYSMSLALKSSEDLIAIKKGTYALREWENVSPLEERRQCNVRSECVADEYLVGGESQ